MILYGSVVGKNIYQMNLERKRDSIQLLLKTNSAGGIIPARRYSNQKSSHRALRKPSLKYQFKKVRNGQREKKEN